MRILNVLAILVSLEVSGAVWFVPGWRTGFSDRTGCVRILQDIYPDSEIRVCSWDSRRNWDVARRNAVIFAGELFREIMALPESSRRELVLIGHSIGSDIVLNVLNRLAVSQEPVSAAVLLAAALPCDDQRISAALNAVQKGICNVFDSGDWVLKYLYPLENIRIIPLGVNGWTGRDRRLVEISSQRQGGGFDRHFAYLYLETFQRGLKTLPVNVQVKQFQPNQERLPADNLFWLDEMSFEKWKIQCHYDGRARLLDPDGVRRSSGTLSEMREALSDVRRQLQNPSSGSE